jgi:hypothetical protein
MGPHASGPCSAASGPGGLYQGPRPSQPWAGPSRTWTTVTCYAIGTTAWPAVGGFSTGPLLGRLPKQGHPPHDPPGYATLRGSWPKQRFGALDSWRTLRGRMPADQAELGTRDAILQLLHANVHPRGWGLVLTRGSNVQMPSNVQFIFAVTPAG